jgi:hypothetical protein
MAWHIFRKDLVLLWPLIALSVVAQFGLSALMFMADRTPDSQYLLTVARIFVGAVFLTIALTVAVGVHQEPIPGTRQDWLIRPIHRRDLLIAKLLFVVAAVQLPMFLADVFEALAQGFPVGLAATAALSRNVFAFVSLTLPALALAAMTKSTAEFVGAGIAYFIALLAATLLLSAIARIGGAEQATNPLAWTGVAWAPQTLARAALAAGAVVALLLLYFFRRVVLARSAFPVFAILSVSTVLLPWGWIFSLQEAASAAPAGTRVVTMTVDASAPRYESAPGENLESYAGGTAQVQLRGREAGDISLENAARRKERDITILISIRIGGLPAQAVPWADRAIVTLRSADGGVIFEGRGDDLKTSASPTASAPVLDYEAVRIPGLLYQTFKAQPLAVEIDYSVSVLLPGQPVEVGALGASSQVTGFGRCSTQRDEDGDDIVLKCLKPGAAPSCVSAILEDPVSGRRNPEIRLCAPDYSPYAAKLFPDALSRYQVEVPFRDRSGLASYPVSGGQLDRASIVIRRYEAFEHLTRRVTSSQITLADLVPNVGVAR